MAGRTGSTKASEEDVKRYFDLIDNKGYSSKQAAEKLGFSKSWAYELNSRRRLQKVVLKTTEPPEPLVWDQLDGGVKDTLKDFNLFCEVFLARDSVPWRRDAANRIVEMLDGQMKAEDPERLNVVINTPPGIGKTTLFSHDIPAWLICGGGWLDPEVGRAMRIMLGHQSVVVSTDYARRLRNFFGLRNPFQEYDKTKRQWREAEMVPAMAFGRFKPKTTAGEESIWRKESFLVAQAGGKEVYQKEPTVQAAGYRTEFIGNRVNLAVWDDLDDERSASSIEQSEQKSSWREGQAETRVEPAGLFCIVQQRISTLDQSEAALEAVWTDDAGESHKLYDHIVYPAHNDATCDNDHRQWDPSEDDGCLLDAKRLPWRDILKAQSKENWLTLYQQESADPAKVLVHPAWLDGEIDPTGYPAPGCYDSDRGFFEWPSDTNLVDYVVVDPSVANYWALEWWAVNPQTRVRHLIWGARKKMNPGTETGFLDWDDVKHCHVGIMEDLQQKSGLLNHPIRIWVVEQNAAHKYLFRTNAYKLWRQKWPLVSVIEHQTQKNKADPDFGVEALLPMVYKTGMARLPAKHGDLDALNYMRAKRDELTKYPFSRTDDTVMANWFGEYNLERIIQEGRRFGGWSQPPAQKNMPRYLQNKIQVIPTP